VLTFDAAPKGSQYTLTSLTPGDTTPSKGTVPAERVLLPVGDYLRVITHPRCQPYGDTVHVDGSAKLPKRNLFCQ
jgi:hypothetical protein